jgi:hypothetical protein
MSTDQIRQYFGLDKDSDTGEEDATLDEDEDDVEDEDEEMHHQRDIGDKDAMVYDNDGDNGGDVYLTIQDTEDMLAYFSDDEDEEMQDVWDAEENPDTVRIYSHLMDIRVIRNLHRLIHLTMMRAALTMSQ